MVIRTPSAQRASIAIAMVFLNCCGSALAATSPFGPSTWTSLNKPTIRGVSLIPPANGLDLNLQRATATIPLAGVLAPGRAVNINVGGSVLRVTAKSFVTPAEYIAVLQVRPYKGVQTLILDSTGIAVGGWLQLNGVLSRRVTFFSVPSGVTAINNVARNRLLLLSGDYINMGSTYFYSTNPLIHSGIMAAGGEIDNFGGLFSSEVDASLKALLPTAHLVPAVSLGLASVRDFQNQGMIRSSEAIAIGTAYGVFSNFGNVGAIAPGNIIANSDIAITSGRQFGTITPITFNNSGTILSRQGTIAFDTPIPAANIKLDFGDGTGEPYSFGFLFAPNGGISVRDRTYVGSAETWLRGGKFDSFLGVNIFGGSGRIVADSTIQPESAAIITNRLAFHTTGDVNIVAGTEIYEGAAPVWTYKETAIGVSTGHNISVSAEGSIDLGTVYSTGDLKIVADVNNRVNFTHLNVFPGAVITSNGNITLQDIDSVGTIAIGYGANLGTSSTTPDQGAITIVAGPIPISPKPGSIPINYTPIVNDISADGVHQVFWGDNSVSSPTTPAPTINIKGQSVVFNAPNDANQIKLGSLVEITADPQPRVHIANFSAETAKGQSNAVTYETASDGHTSLPNSSTSGFASWVRGTFIPQQFPLGGVHASILSIPSCQSENVVEAPSLCKNPSSSAESSSDEWVVDSDADV
jgi:hypothetical protein